MRIAPLCFAIIVSLSPLALSQEMQQGIPDSLREIHEPKYALEPIIITATRTERPILSVPYAIDVVGEGEIQRAEVGLSLDEALRSIPGVVVDNRYNLSRGDRINIRGIGSRAAFGVHGLKVILDGVPLTMPDGQTLLNNLDLGSAGNIEILRGPSSSLYGNAAGGLINVQTQSAPSLPFLAQPRFIVGSDGYRKWQGKVSGTIGSHTYFINANMLKLDGFREHSSASSTSLNAVGKHEMSDHITLTTVFNYFDAPYLLNPGSLSKTDAAMSPTTVPSIFKQLGAGKQIRHGQGGITLNYADDRASQFQITGYGLSRLVLVSIPGGIFDYDWKSGGMRAAFSKRFRVWKSPLRWSIGTDIEALKTTVVRFENQGLPEDQVETADGSRIFDLLQYGPRLSDQDEKVRGLGAFTELEFSPNPKWMLTLGQRYDHYKFEAVDHFMEDGVDDSGTRNMNSLSPMVGITYRPHDLIKLYGNHSTAFQTPTTVELGNRSTGEGGFNPTLKPERMLSNEVGIKGMWPFGIEGWPGRRFDYDVSLYVLDIKDMLIPFQTPATEEVFYRNAGKTQNRGVEIKVDWFPVKGLRTSLAYTFMDFVFEEFEVETSAGDSTQLVQLAGNDVPGVSPHHIFAGITYEHPMGVYTEANLRWVDQYVANDFNGPPPGSDKPIEDFVNDAYAVVDVRLGLQQTFNGIGVEFFLGLNNLFDKRFNGSIVPNAARDRFFEPAPGRSWHTGLSIRIPGR